MKRNYYAVRKGRQVGIFESWKQCKEQIHGFSGAEYKKFTSIEDAENFINYTSSAKQSPLMPNHYEIWCDGSFSDEQKAAGYGFLIVKDNVIVYEDYGTVTEPEFISARNIAGEIIAAISARELLPLIEV